MKVTSKLTCIGKTCPLNTAQHATTSTASNARLHENAPPLATTSRVPSPQLPPSPQRARHNSAGIPIPSTPKRIRSESIGQMTGSLRLPGDLPRSPMTPTRRVQNLVSSSSPLQHRWAQASSFEMSPFVLPDATSALSTASRQTLDYSSRESPSLRLSNMSSSGSTVRLSGPVTYRYQY